MDDDSDLEVVSTSPAARNIMATLRKQQLPRDIDRVSVVPSPIANKHEYKWDERWDRVEEILEEVEDTDVVQYTVRFGDTRTETVPFETLLKLDNGSSALEQFQQNPNISKTSNEDTSEDELNASDDNMRLRLRMSDQTSEDNFTSDQEVRRSTRQRHVRGLRYTRGDFPSSSSEEEALQIDSDSDTPALSVRRSSRRAAQPKKKTASNSRVTRQSRRQITVSESSESGSDSDDGIPRLRSDVIPRKRKRTSRDDESSKMARVGTRRSDRATRHQENMEDPGLDDNLYRQEEPKSAAVPKASGAKEVFKELPRTDPFRLRHIQQCDTCGNGSTIGPLIYCQGCQLSYHKGCLGHRTGREHLVTKIAEDEFVLQCRRCVNAHKKRDIHAPDLDKCQVCRKTGTACQPFRQRKSALQEQKEREDNDGEDPICHLPNGLVNNPFHILFRCMTCWRAFHFHHLPPKSAHHLDIDEEEEETAERRFSEYSQSWKCRDCSEMPVKVGGIIAWKPTDEESYMPGMTCEHVDEDEKAYLIKWEKLSYFRAAWMSGAWTWGVTASSMRKAFFKRETGPKMRTEDAIPEEFLRIDIVLDVKYTNVIDVRTEDIDKARIKEVDEALIKYKGLGYEDAVWEKVPTPEDDDRWLDFVTAYNDWVLGRYTHAPKKSPLQVRLEKARSQPFTKLEKQKQPDNLQSGMELMKYQIDGLNWLYYQWYSKKNGILADEMGLGKTIQIIAFLATLIQDHNCFPFLVVVPNSTCANWRREIKQWAPSLRVVTYFGSSLARTMAYQYEMFPEGSKDLRCHIVVTSYEAAADDSCRKFFKSVSWAGLVVDEGQRLKSDKSILYNALNGLKIPFRVLLTGTPLQNNARELFNLLQFLDDTIDATALEEEYADMTNEKIKELHDLIRPYILRRTKAQVLTFLPSMAQIIVPISMSVLQKELYKSILAKNPELLKVLFSTNRHLKLNERASLNNILMQLRKCLCHPFVYSQEIEERTDVAAVSHRNLVEASAKLQFLELLLPKLRAAGHRVLIFSQFLDMLNIVEDFLDGMEMAYGRLDGTIGSLEKQKRIDEFNAPGSSLFAFLLSTRAGGVGINLATADTVIILDPDFNPHQDIQALSRAHRIGQKNKVLCFQLMTRVSVEERIVQIGRKKMALDHVVVESMDADDLEEKDVQSILKHGAAELFAEDNSGQDIKYDEASIDKLLDRSQIEESRTGADATAESQFSFARVWANDSGALQDSLDINGDEEVAPPDPTVWEKILQERARAAAADAAKKDENFGRGKRARMLVDYNEPVAEAEAEAPEEGPPVEPENIRRRKKPSTDSDTDFQANDSDDESIPEEELQQEDARDLNTESRSTQVHGIAAAGQGRIDTSTVAKKRKPERKPERKRFERAPDPQFPPGFPSHLSVPKGYIRNCPACQHTHPIGACPLKIAGAEYCNLCGLAHFGFARSCPHINSETQVREMLATLKHSNEPRHIVEAATKYLRGVKGTLVQKKKQQAEKRAALANNASVMNTNGHVIPNQSRAPTTPGPNTWGMGILVPSKPGHHQSQSASAYRPNPDLHSRTQPPAGAQPSNNEAAVVAALTDYLQAQDRPSAST
ncbi:PHD/FYVE-zinc-finger like domain-containing protein [Phyllosticta citribraziliensis]|uniref:PHD/FYVE-zinc-finger like domain-containing protein n=1 Tax=Phyllosticta citribraziliensis TaxID=989973 RepID=A0ABR1M4Z2_9PEZI